MKFSTLLCVFLVLLIEVYATKLAPGPEAVKESTTPSTTTSPTSKSETTPAPPQKNQKRYATREIILYLTPSQIKALEAGQGLVSAQSSPEAVHSEQHEHAKIHHETELVQHQLENIKSASIAGGQEHINGENLELISEQPLIHKEVHSIDNHQEYDHWRHEQAIREEQLRLHHYYQELDRARLFDLHQAVNLNDGRIPLLQYSPEIQIRQEHHVEEPHQVGEIVSQNQFHSKVLSPLSLHESSPVKVIQRIEKPLLQLHYTPKYNDQKSALIENFLRTRHRHELERQIAFAQAERITNSPAEVVHEEVKVRKHQPVAEVKQVKVSDPVVVPFPELLGVKLPHLYPLSQEIIKHIPVPTVQGKRTDAERLDSRKELFNLNRPYFLQELIPEGVRHAPVHKEKKVTPLRPVWNH